MGTTGKRALISGITGQDGSYLAEFLLAKGYVVHGIIRRSSSFNTQRIDALYRDFHEAGARLFLHYGDLTDANALSSIIHRVAPSEVYNLGAQSHVRVSFDMPIYTTDADALGAIRLLEAVRDYRDRTDQEVRYYQASSSEMFGKVHEIPQTEATPFYPRSPYGVSKLYAYWIVKNYRESYHDAIEYRDQMYSLFNLGMLDLEERAKCESLFWEVAKRAVRYSRTAKHTAEEFIELASKLHDKYICNFSVFQSLPDHWALDQLFPVLPIHRLNEFPSRKATLVDITCDSDGEVEKFVDLKDIKGALELHPLLPGRPYYLAFTKGDRYARGKASGQIFIKPSR